MKIKNMEEKQKRTKDNLVIIRQRQISPKKIQPSDFWAVKWREIVRKEWGIFFCTDLEIDAAANIVFTNCHLLSLQQNRKDSC